MNVDSFLISDYADETNGKLIIIGTFDTIYVPQFPHVHPLMAFSMVIHGHRDEAGREISLEIKVLDQDRKQIGLINGSGALPTAAAPGLPLRSVLAGRIHGIPFQKEGAYAFEVYLNGTYHAGAVLYAKQRS